MNLCIYLILIGLSGCAAKTATGFTELNCFERNEANGEIIEFIADGMDSCVYWRCLNRKNAVLMRCAQGTGLSATYTAGETNPCVQRKSETSCKRYEEVAAITTTEVPITLPGGIPFPVEHLTSKQPVKEASAHANQPDYQPPAFHPLSGIPLPEENLSESGKRRLEDVLKLSD